MAFASNTARWLTRVRCHSVTTPSVHPFDFHCLIAGVAASSQSSVYRILSNSFPIYSSPICISHSISFPSLFCVYFIYSRQSCKYGNGKRWGSTEIVKGKVKFYSLSHYPSVLLLSIDCCCIPVFYPDRVPIGERAVYGIYDRRWWPNGNETNLFLERNRTFWSFPLSSRLLIPFCF